MKKIFIFGMGYVAQHLAKILQADYNMVGCSRKYNENNDHVYLWDGAKFDQKIADELKTADAILCSIPPNEQGDLAFLAFEQVIAKSAATWIGYLSTTGVYGDHQGGIVGEQTALNAQNIRAKRRIVAENQFCSLERENLSINVFRLPGIYGAGRSNFETINAGRAKRIDMRLKNGKPHFFCRAHVEDIAAVLKASLEKSPKGCNVYNIADDMPAPNQMVIEYATNLMQVDGLPLISAADANLSLMAKSFYSDCKHVSNQKIKQQLGIKLKYPNYKLGLGAIWRQMKP